MTEKLPEEVEQVLLGSLFGDGSLERRKPRGKGIIKKRWIGPRFREVHSINQKEYLLWKKEILSQTFIIKNYTIFTRKEKETSICSLNSPLLEKYYSYFYPTGKGKKIFTLEMLNKLKPLGLAIWYMDDGNFDKVSYRASVAVPKRYSKMIKKWLKNSYNLNSKIYLSKITTSSRILFNVEDTKKLFRIIHPYIHPSMKYKIKRTKEELLIIRRKQRIYQQNPKRKEKAKENKKIYQKEYYQRNRERIKQKNRRKREREK